MLEGTRKLFPHDYEEFKSAILEAAEDDELPVHIRLDDIRDFTLKDVQDMFSDFRRDTGLEMEGHLALQPGRQKLQLAVKISLPELHPDEDIPLQ